MTTRILTDAEPGHCESCDARPPEGADFVEVLRWIGQWQAAAPDVLCRWHRKRVRHAKP